MFNKKNAAFWKREGEGRGEKNIGFHQPNQFGCYLNSFLCTESSKIYTKLIEQSFIRKSISIYVKEDRKKYRKFANNRIFFSKLDGKYINIIG